MRILFVCMGNICRSPTAEGLFKHIAAHQAGLQFEVDSAGTHDYHVGEAPDKRAVAAAKQRGVDLTGLRARTVEPQDFERFDLILAMDRENLGTLQQRAPAHARERIKLVLDFAPDAHTREVPDPYYGGAKGFEEVLDLLEQAAQGLIAQLNAQNSDRRRLA